MRKRVVVFVLALGFLFSIAAASSVSFFASEKETFEISKIKITNLPYRLIYIPSEEIDLKGMIVEISLTYTINEIKPGGGYIPVEKKHKMQLEYKFFEEKTREKSSPGSNEFLVEIGFNEIAKGIIYVDEEKRERVPSATALKKTVTFTCEEVTEAAYNYDVDTSDNKFDEISDMLNGNPRQIQPATREGYDFEGFYYGQRMEDYNEDGDYDDIDGEKGPEMIWAYHIDNEENKVENGPIYNKDGKKTDSSEAIDPNFQSNGLYAKWTKRKYTINNSVYTYDGKEHIPDGIVVDEDSGYIVKYYENDKYEKEQKEIPKFKQIGAHVVYFKILDKNNNNKEVDKGTVQVVINGPRKNMMPGFSGLQGYHAGDSLYDYLYIGSHIYGSGSEDVLPIKFNILSTQTNDDNEKAGMLLYSSNILASAPYHEGGNCPDYMSYYTSSIRGELSNVDDSLTDPFGGSFTSAEKSAIMVTKSTQVSGAKTMSINEYTSPYLGGDQLFLLSNTDLLNPNYFPNAYSASKDTVAKGADDTFWVSTRGQYRKFFDFDVKTYTYGLKGLEDKDSSSTAFPLSGLRVAMNIKSDDVAFVSSTPVQNRKGLTESGAKSTAVGSKVKKMTQDVQEIYTSFKLTLFDTENLKLTSQDTAERIVNDINGENRINLKVSYEIKDAAQGNEYISAIITQRDSGEIMYYSRIKKIEKEAKTGAEDVCIELPNDENSPMESDKYDIKLFLERYNGDGDANKTDYISDYVTIPLTVYSQMSCVEPNKISVVYDSLEHSIDDPDMLLPKLEFVNITYALDNENGIDDEVYTTEKPYVKDVKYNEKGEPVPYIIKYKISIKEQYKDHKDYKGFGERTGAVELLIQPSQMQCDVTGVDTVYNGVENYINVIPYTDDPGAAKIQYKKQGEKEYSDTSPAFKDVVDTATIKDGKIVDNGITVYYKVEQKNYETLEGSTRARISQTSMYMSSESVTVAYDGSPHSVNIDNYMPHAGEVDIYYYTQNGKTKDKPSHTEAGEYTETFDVVENDGKYNYKSSLNNQARLSILETSMSYQSEGYTGEYDGDNHTISLYLNAPIASECDIRYLVQEGQPTDSDWNNATTQKPEFKDVGIYKVWFKIKSNNYKESIKSEQVVINQAKIICYESQPLNVVYDGMQHSVPIYVAQPTADKARVIYSADGGRTYTLEEPPQYKDVGTYRIYYRVEAGSNYEVYEGEKTLIISPRSIKRAVVDTISSRIYTGRPITPSIIINDGGQYIGVPNIITENDYIITYANNIEKGEATATITGINNYEDQVTETFYIVDGENTQVNIDNSLASSDSSSETTYLSESSENSSGGIGDLLGSGGNTSPLTTGESIKAVLILTSTFILAFAVFLIVLLKRKRV